jgi:hypothetical protein
VVRPFHGDREQSWWFDGGLWWPTESADGHQRFDGQYWIPKRRWPRVLYTVSCVLVLLSPLAFVFGFFLVAGGPIPPGDPPRPDWVFPVVFAVQLMIPAAIAGFVVAKEFTGQPGLGKRGQVRWIWTPPPGWSTPPHWAPTPGWEPDPSWPPPPEQWRGWVRQYPRTINW